MPAPLDGRPPLGRQADLAAGSQRGHKRQERPLVAIVARQVVQRARLFGLVRSEHDVQSLDVLDERRILLARVLETQDPIDGRESLVDDRFGGHPQAGVGIGPGDSMLPAIGQFRGLGRAFPVLEQLGRRLAAQHEEKGRPVGGKGSKEARLLGCRDSPTNAAAAQSAMPAISLGAAMTESCGGPAGTSGRRQGQGETG